MQCHWTQDRILFPQTDATSAAFDIATPLIMSVVWQWQQYLALENILWFTIHKWHDILCLAPPDKQFLLVRLITVMEFLFYYLTPSSFKRVVSSEIYQICHYSHFI